eukprot:TRINITY_DN1966_c0_g1_i4.p1 TRINITY_DN1966_c0_g1~~TRINITY_DN1966_c0_g1_i4.p1  ORF type:complete len:849 (+),score=349.07 TRINITY_DN1966_c0_g1_i4:153-2699(+)
MDEVLEMIADTVSTLVIAVRDSEEKNTVFGDMVPAATGLQRGVDGMVAAAEEAVENVHEEFRGQISTTAGALKKTTAGLMESALAGRSEPNNRGHQRAAIRYAKQMLEKVVYLVLIEDQSNIKTLVDIGKRAGSESQRVLETENVKHLPMCLPEIEASLASFISRAQAKADGSKNMDFKGRIEAAIRTIQSAAPTYFSSLEASIARPSPAARKQATEDLRNLTNAIDEIIVVVRLMFEANSKFVDAAFKWQPIRTIAEDQLHQATRHLIDSLIPLRQHASQGTGTQQARQVVQAANAAMDAASAVADATNDPVKRQMIHRRIDELKKLTPQVIQALKDHMQNPDDIEAARRLDELIKNAQYATSDLQAAAGLTVPEYIASSASAVNATLDTLADAIRKGDGAAIKTATHNAVAAIDRHIEALQAYADSISDPDHKREVLAQIARLQQLRAQIADVGERLAQNPMDKALAAQLDKLIAEARREVNQNIDPSATVSAANHSLQNNLDLLEDCIARGDANMAFEAVQIAKNIAADMAREIAAAEAFLATLTDPQRRKEVSAAIQKMKALSPKLLEAVKDVLANPNDARAQQRLKDIIAETRQASDELDRVCQLTPEELQAKRQKEMEEKRKRLQAAQAAQRASEAPPMQRIKIEGPVNAAVLQAAQAVEDEVANKAHDDSPMGQLVQTSHSIAEEMAKLSMYAAQGNVKEMIMCARKITELIQKIISNAKNIADTCTDPRLKADVLNYAQATTSFGTQLKIICSVKAAEEKPDPATENQLVTCAQGISDCVIRAIKAAESASIRSAGGARPGKTGGSALNLGRGAAKPAAPLGGGAAKPASGGAKLGFGKR